VLESERQQRQELETQIRKQAEELERNYKERLQEVEQLANKQRADLEQELLVSRKRQEELEEKARHANQVMEHISSHAQNNHKSAEEIKTLRNEVENLQTQWLCIYCTENSVDTILLPCCCTACRECWAAWKSTGKKECMSASCKRKVAQTKPLNVPKLVHDNAILQLLP